MTALKRISSKLFVPPLVSFSIVMLLASLGDAIMSYVAPVYIEQISKSPLIMGLIISTSSVAGLIFDFLISAKQWRKDYRYFTKAMVYISFLFPLCLMLLPPTPLILIISMIIWGAYYEYKGFASFSFIHHFLTPQEHTKGWGVLTTYRSWGYLIGPIIAAFILEKGFQYSFTTSMLPFFLAWLIYKLTPQIYKNTTKVTHKNVKEVKKSWIATFKIIYILWNKVWPVFLFSLAIMIIDSIFWTVGALMSEELKMTSTLGGFMLAVYMVPSVFSHVIDKYLHKDFGKKRTSFVAGIIAGLFLLAMGTTHNTYLILFAVLCMAFFLNVAFVLQSAIIEDYVARLGEFANDMVTISQSAGSAAYIIGPIIGGAFAQILGYHGTFQATGVLIIVVGVFSLIVVPRKIKMPQTQLKETANLS